ncbi:MAG: PGN_0703 family putative restriction endonuclease [Acidobacteriota bacterium]
MHAGALRRELAERNRDYATGRAHVQSYGEDPVVVYEPEEAGHGNFYGPSYEAIMARPAWAKRFNKIHAQGKALPKAESGRRWRELDSCMSSDALLMNFFCAPGVHHAAGVRRMLGVESDALPEFGWKAKVPLKSGLFDRTEVDMRWGDLLVEAKLTEADFQTRAAAVVEAYRDFDAVFERERLPQVEFVLARRRQAGEFPEDFSQEHDETDGLDMDQVQAIAAAHQEGIAQRALEAAPRERRYLGYQLIRNVPAAYAHGCRFCVVHDARRPDLREAWFDVMAAVRDAEMRMRCAVLTWQELAAVAPEGLRRFLGEKYGITP